MRIAKAAGVGNDFLLMDLSEAPRDLRMFAQVVCDRHNGIGADGLILYGLSGGGASMRLRNADGGEAEISGNGLRCLSAFLVSKGWLSGQFVVLTAAGPKAVTVSPLGSRSFRIETDLGRPILESREIPLALEPPRESVVDLEIEVGGRRVRATCTSLGNPHCALFLDAPAEDALVTTLGPLLEHHPLFPRRTNVEFVTVVSPGELRVRFWERGVGMTRSSGTGAASAVVASSLSGRSSRSARVLCDGGVLLVDWGDSVRQTGEAEVLFEADWVGGVGDGS